MRRIFLTMLSLFLLTGSYAQVLKPGFDKAEYLELLKVCARHGDSNYIKTIPQPQHCVPVYRSPVVGLENRWDLWIRDDNVAVMSIRGTTANRVSWLANFYAAMVPATGELRLNPSETFTYRLADNPRAAIHIGWLIATAYLSKDMMPKLDSLYRKGIRDVIVMGHSQGGSIAYLLTAYFYQLQKQGKLPADTRFKTYCSASPKPGNLYFAYDYEVMTRGGWACNVVNSADWVPETPLSVQTLNDFNKTNLFAVAPYLIKKQKWPVRWVMKYAYNRLDKPSKKVQRRYEKYLGRMVGKRVLQHIKTFQPPGYYASSDYVRTGNTIVLYADDGYYKLYPDSKENVFIHHFFGPYIYLTEKLPNDLHY
jgi:hypothetical protein